MRPWALLAAGLAALLVAAGSADAKEGASAELTSPLALDAKPGSTVRIAWKVEVGTDAGRRPWNAIGMFVRLLSRTGAPATIGFAAPTAHPDGLYTARVRVPRGGIGGVRAGLRGSTDLPLEILNDPFRSPSGVRCDAAAARATLAAFVRAFNRGDARRVDALFSREYFVWFSSGRAGPRLREEASRRETVPAYVRARHRRSDTIVLRTVTFNGYDASRILGHFGLTGTRRAADANGGRTFAFEGKGALDCHRPGPIAVLSLG